MAFQIPPEIQATINVAIAWLWSQYGKALVEKATDKVVDEANWRWSIGTYYRSLFERIGFVRILGRMEAEPLENVFTHINVLDKLSAERRYDITRLKTEFDPRNFDWHKRVPRLSGEEAVDEFDKLFILGKPGAGKTTFLKYTALRAIKGDVDKVPIFVTLKELADSGQDIFEFITHQFSVHQFPKPKPFVEKLLKNGDAIVLLDGLDEVNLADNQRSRLIAQINDFVYRYNACPMLLTCRVAATDYSFTQFEYVEMADFDADQMARYIDLWFVYDKVKAENCRKELLEDKENKGVRELAQVPLLLALLCLVYEERNEFPPNRDEIYDEATRALLVRWDASRNISRDTVYKQLSLKHKQKMLAFIAAQTFEKGDYFLREKEVVTLIEAYLQGVPGLEEPDGERVLKVMEAQHGIFVERARRIHSFSHLTLQEYFTAVYVVDNEKQGTVERLMDHVGDNHWSEVFLLTAGMLTNATEFCQLFLKRASQLIVSEPQLVGMLQWCEQKRTTISQFYRPAALRTLFLNSARIYALDIPPTINTLILDSERELELSLTLALDLDIDLALDMNIDCDLADFANDSDIDLTYDYDYVHTVVKARDYKSMQTELEDLTVPQGIEDSKERYSFTRAFAAILDKYQDEWDPYRKISITDEELGDLWQLSEPQQAKLMQYLEANLLLTRCLQVAYVPNRAAIEDQILLPPV